MPNIHTLKPSKYIKKEDCEPPILVTIKNISQENLARDNEAAEMKYCLHFAEDYAPLVMNWTNLQLCARACGSEDTDDWPGKQIVLFNDPNVSFGGNMTGGVRIRAKKGQESEDPSEGIPF